MLEVSHNIVYIKYLIRQALSETNSMLGINLQI